MSSSSMSPEERAPLFDAVAYRETASLLPPARIAAYLQTLIDRCEGVLAPGLDRAQAVDDAHMLAGAAGMFGMTRLVSSARNFELAVEMKAADAEARGIELRTDAALSIDVLRQLVADLSVMT